jgi:hypothetical protein
MALSLGGCLLIYMNTCKPQAHHCCLVLVCMKRPAKRDVSCIMSLKFSDEPTNIQHADGGLSKASRRSKQPSASVTRAVPDVLTMVILKSVSL